MTQQVLLSTAYFPNIQYFSKLIAYKEVWLEACENYSKQSYRNRCDILTANGVLSLSVPVISGRSPGMGIRDVKIDYSEDWQKNHWKTIESAYKHAPYFDFVCDQMMFVFQQKYRFLFDLNSAIMEKILAFIGVSKKLQLTRAYQKDVTNGIADFRQSIHPKKRMQKEDPEYKVNEYLQVFSDRFKFQPSLSIIDLMMNEGSNTLSIIEASFQSRISS